MSIAIAVHGGAWAMPDALVSASAEGCRRGLEAGLSVLRERGSSLDAVEAAVRVLEDDPVFDAGFGSFLNEDGMVECDAGIMDGRFLRVGSVAAVPGVPHPVTLARRVLESPLAFVVGEGARRFAERAGVAVCDPEAMVAPDEFERWRSSTATSDELVAAGLFGDTVGAVAVDVRGDVAAATSTGGTPKKPSGRVGDSPIVGTGVFADNASAAVSTTGHGELIIPLVWACSAAALLTAGTPPERACVEALRILDRTGARGGLIMVDPAGRVAAAYNTPRMAYAYFAEDQGDVVVSPERGNG